MGWIKTWIAAPLVFFGLMAEAQVIRLETEHMVEDDLFQKSQSIVPVYKYESDSIEAYSRSEPMRPIWTGTA